MKKTKIATSIAEAIVVLTIIVMGLTGVYNIYTKSMDLTIAVENKIQAIQIAREGIEAVTNIRDTNWLVFSSDPKNCWKTFNYDDGCVGEDDPFSLARQDIVTGLAPSNFKVYKNTDDRWELEREPIAAAGTYSSEQYRNFYRVNKDSDGLYTQDGTGTDFNPVYTRKIQITYIDDTRNNPDTGTPFYSPSSGETFEGLLVKSIVNWSSDGNISEIELQTILTNHKK